MTLFRKDSLKFLLNIFEHVNITPEKVLKAIKKSQKSNKTDGLA